MSRGPGGAPPLYPKKVPTPLMFVGVPPCPNKEIKGVRNRKISENFFFIDVFLMVNDKFKDFVLIFNKITARWPNRSINLTT